jgi:sugar transferase (PEP-CTERM/EpsH1 system associated)
MEKLLFLAHRIPFPPNKGDKIRSFNLLKKLAKDYQVFLGAFIDDEQDWQYIHEMQKICSQCCFLPLDPFKSKLRSLKGFLHNQPLSLPYYENSEMSKWVEGVIKDNGIERVVVFSSAMAQYVDPEWPAHKLIDFVDVDSDKWQQYSEGKPWPMSWVYRREGERLLGYDRSIAKAFDASIFVSKQEAELFKTLAPESAGKITHIENGVDTEYFDPAIEHENPYPESEQVIVFTGAMDYWANADAVNWFAKAVFPKILQYHLNARFYIVGARPSELVTALEQLEGVHVTGSVKDIRPYLRHAELVVAPMRIARGVQNKVLEAMAMAKPVVVTTPAIEGIREWQRIDVVVEDDAEKMAQLIRDQLNRNQEIHSFSKENRECIKTHYSWENNLQRIEQLLEKNNPELQSAL